MTRCLKMVRLFNRRSVHYKRVDKVTCVTLFALMTKLPHSHLRIFIFTINELLSNVYWLKEKKNTVNRFSLFSWANCWSPLWYPRKWLPRFVLLLMHESLTALFCLSLHEELSAVFIVYIYHYKVVISRAVSNPRVCREYGKFGRYTMKQLW